MRWALYIWVTMVLALGCKGADPFHPKSNSKSKNATQGVAVRGSARLGQATQHAGIVVATTQGGFATKTDAEGHFSFPALPVGTFDFRFEKTGYETVRVDAITIVAAEGGFALDGVELAPIGASPHGRLMTPDGNTTIYSADIKLTISASESTVSMRISEAKYFDVAPWQPLVDSITHSFTKPGEHEILYAFKDARGLESMPASLRLVVKIGRGSWKPMNSKGAPTARSHMHALWTGKNLLLWGGVEKGKTVGTGAFYDPALDQWTKISATGAPSSRLQGAAAWTGDAFLVWGGFHNETLPKFRPDAYQADGAIYRPASDSWSPMSNKGAPSARSTPNHAWTGKELIVWGGYTRKGDESVVPFADGALYNPATNTWRAMASAGAPKPRIQNVSVWTGSKMIIWGGLDKTGTVLGDGAIYDPLANNWTPLSMHNAPTARTLATATWTGEQMIVWSGWEKNMRDGAFYDPQTDTWTPMPADSAPSPRISDGSAVWTGTDMIIWGGYGEDQALLDEGVMFHPQSGSWSYAANAGAPQKRADHMAIWTGQSLIVWGGVKAMGLEVGGSDVWNDGAIYTP